MNKEKQLTGIILFQLISKHGIAYNPASDHYKKGPVNCDRCKKRNLTICIGLHNMDLCSHCWNDVGVKKDVNSDFYESDLQVLDEKVKSQMTEFLLKQQQIVVVEKEKHQQIVEKERHQQIVEKERHQQIMDKQNHQQNQDKTKPSIKFPDINNPGFPYKSQPNIFSPPPSPEFAPSAPSFPSSFTTTSSFAPSFVSPSTSPFTPSFPSSFTASSFAPSFTENSKSNPFDTPTSFHF